MQDTHFKRVTLKNGSQITVRTIQDSDEGAMIHFFNRLPADCIAYERHNVKDPDVIRALLRYRSRDQILYIGAFNGKGRMVGYGTLSKPYRGWRRHIGEIRTTVAPDYQDLGLGRSITYELVSHASMMELHKLEAMVLDDQLAGQRTLERLEFQSAARLKDHAIDHNNVLHDLLIYTHNVQDLWNRMEDLVADLEISRDGY